MRAQWKSRRGLRAGRLRERRLREEGEGPTGGAGGSGWVARGAGGMAVERACWACVTSWAGEGALTRESGPRECGQVETGPSGLSAGLLCPRAGLREEWVWAVGLG